MFSINITFNNGPGTTADLPRPVSSANSARSPGFARFLERNFTAESCQDCAELLQMLGGLFWSRGLCAHYKMRVQGKQGLFGAYCGNKQIRPLERRNYMLGRSSEALAIQAYK